MSKMISEIRVYDSSSRANIFTATDKPYQIPLYQRAFAWEQRQLEQLIEDIEANDADNYYIGSLIVASQGGYYEVIDGQQRLTALFLLLNYLLDQAPAADKLCFACRRKSNYTLSNLDNILKNGDFDEERVQDTIRNGAKIIAEKVGDKETFLERLSKVIIYRIIVPEHTDLNRYFEIMNTRGEQLSQHDILKAKLMSYYGDDMARSSRFAIIWDACSNMNGYVQIHFTPALREQLFGSNWGEIPTNISNIKFTAHRGKPRRISDIIKPDFDLTDTYIVKDDKGGDIRTRFESIIDFPHFLIHSLKVYARNKIANGEKLFGELIDDKKLLKYFDDVIARINDKPRFATEFIKHLLRMRFFFDKYIIKREYVGDDADGEWSIKTLKVSGQGSSKRAYFNDSEFKNSRQWSKTASPLHKPNLMIQSALRVSYTSPKVMHWITALLEWLNDDQKRNNLNKFCRVAEDVARGAIREHLRDNKWDAIPLDGGYRLGVATPHIVLNYLDYLLWAKYQTKYADFTFEFRTSVEHWYPQNPNTTEIEKWSDEDRFGNLCIMHRNINSKFSNLRPTGKQSSFKEAIAKGSLKLRMMSDKTKGDINWRDVTCAAHEDEMLSMLNENIKK